MGWRSRWGLLRAGFAVVACAVAATFPSHATATQYAASAPPLTSTMHSPAGSMPAGPRANGTAVLPDGRLATPAGRTITVDLQPNNVALSHDGSRLYVSSEGLDDQPSPTDHAYHRFVSVVDTATMTRRRVQDDALNFGLAETPDGKLLLVSEGHTGSIGVFSVGDWKKLGSIPLGSGAYPWGLTISPEGKYGYTVDFRRDELDVIDISARKMIASIGTGQWPFGVALSPDGKTAYVTNWGMYNVQAPTPLGTPPASPVDLPPVAIGGYNTNQSSSVWSFDVSSPSSPTVGFKTRIGADVNGYSVLSGSLPSGLALSPDGTTLATTASNDDLVALLDAKTGAVKKSFDMHVFGPSGPTGDMPDAVAWDPDGSRLYVAEGGENDIAVMDPSGKVLGRIPTGWYPSAVAVGTGGAHLYIASNKGLGSGPNSFGPSHSADKNGTDPPYIDNLLRGTVEDVTLSCNDLGAMSAVVAQDDGLVVSGPDGDGSVIPTNFGASPSAKLKHVVVILKENRTFDQVFGDLQGAERDQRLNIFGGKVTPNHHALARMFATDDNFFDTVQTSVDGHWLFGTGQVDEFDLKTSPTSYTDNFGSTNGIVQTAPENMPIGGFQWNNFYRHGVSFRVYGEAYYLAGTAPTYLGTPDPDPSDPKSAVPAAFNQPNNFSATFPNQLTVSPTGVGTTSPQLSPATDEQRADDYLRELQVNSATGIMPQFSYMVLPKDHTDGYSPGAPTPETYMADNDHALGRIVDGISKSPFWKDTVIFVVEDDTQDGQDHLDAHRVTQLAASPYIKHGHISHVHLSNFSMQKTIDLILGVPPTSAQEATATSMADYFMSTPDLSTYNAVPETTTPGTNPPKGAAQSNAKLAEAAAIQDTIPVDEFDPGPALTRVLELVHDGKAELDDPNVAPTPDIQEHTLTQGSPVSIAEPPSGCASETAGARQVAVLPNTSGIGDMLLRLAVLGLALFALGFTIAFALWNADR